MGECCAALLLLQAFKRGDDGELGGQRHLCSCLRADEATTLGGFITANPMSPCSPSHILLLRHGSFGRLELEPGGGVGCCIGEKEDHYLSTATSRWGKKHANSNPLNKVACYTAKQW